MLSDDKTTLTDILKEQIETYRQRDELKESCQILTQQLHQVSCERNDLQAELLTLRAEVERLRGVWAEGPPVEVGVYWAEFEEGIILTQVLIGGVLLLLDKGEMWRPIGKPIRHIALTPPTKE